MSYEKKTYTMEDNVKSMVFAFKDVLKQLNQINTQLAKIMEIIQNKNNTLPF